MSFPAYDEYKDSGIEWVGKVPLHWETMKLGRVTIDRCDGPFGSGLKSSHYVDEGIRVIRLNNIRHNHFDDSDAAFIDPVHYHEELGSGHDVVAGDLLIAGLGDDNNAVGRACVAPDGIEPAMVKADCFRYRLDQDLVLPSFMSAQLTVGAPTDSGMLSTGTTRSRMPLSVTSSRRVALPPLDEQKAISSFLDMETSKIDGLVSEQGRLIELLKEKRQAVISHAVTKGLNPNAPMKPSGIQWLGDVPQHWSVPPLYTRYEQVLGKMLDQNKMTGEHPTPYVRNVDVQWDRVNSDDLPIMDIKPEERERFTVSNGDVLICEGGEVGRTAIWDGGDGVIAFQKAIHRLRPLNDTEDCRYFFYTMRFATGMNVFLANSNPNTIPHLTGEQLRPYRFPKPPIEEQHAIADFLDQRTLKFDTLIAEAERAIELLQERRTALISAAVTGKIDVRQFAHQETA